jgi:RHS repeat-associated protein
MADTSGNVVARYLYDPYGNLLGKWGALADANRYRFSSKEIHPNSGLYYYGFRFYEPNLQRWLNRDPIGEAGGINLYQFNRNNPVSFIDPWGLTTYVWPPENTPPGIYGPTVTIVNDGSTAVLPAVPYLTDSQGLQSTDLDFLPFFLPEIPAVSKALDAAGDALGNLGKKLLKSKPTECPKPSLTGPEAARAALGKGPNAIPGAPLTPEMRAALQQNLQAAQSSLNLARQGLNVAGNPTDAAQLATQIATSQARINQINAILQSGVQAPKN